MTPGTVVVLNGTSSSGKTTLARAFQELMAEAGVPYVYLDTGEAPHTLARLASSV